MSNQLVFTEFSAAELDEFPFLTPGDVILSSGAKRMLEAIARECRRRWSCTYSERHAPLPVVSEILARHAGPRALLSCASAFRLDIGDELVVTDPPVVMQKLLQGQREFIRQRFRAGEVVPTFRATSFERLFGESFQSTGIKSDEACLQELVKEVGLFNLLGPSQVAERISATLFKQFGDRLSESFYSRLTQFLATHPGRDISALEWDELWAPMKDVSEAAKEIILAEVNATIFVIYAPIAAGMARAHRRTHISRVLRKSGLEAFCEQQPFGLGIPGEAGIFRICRATDQGLEPAFPTYFLRAGHGESQLIYPLIEDATSESYFPDFKRGETWTICELYITLTESQLNYVRNVAVTHVGQVIDTRRLRTDRAVSIEIDTVLAPDAGARRVATNRRRSLEELRDVYAGTHRGRTA